MSISAKRQSKSTTLPIVTVVEVDSATHDARGLRHLEIRRGFLKWVKRQRTGRSPAQSMNDSHFFEQARAYDTVEPLVPLLVIENRSRSYPEPGFGAPW